MPSLGKFGGPTPLKFIRLSISKIGKDEVSTRSAALSYYFLLSLFPMFLFVSSVIGVFARPDVIEKITSSLGKLAPGSATNLVHNVVSQTLQHNGGIKMAIGMVGALWAASGGMSAIVTSLNAISEVEENRPWWKRKLTVLLLTVGVAILTLCALTLALYGGNIGRMVAGQIGLRGAFSIKWSVLQWPLVLFAVFLSYSLIYYYAPALKVRTWHWSTPGAVVGLSLWILA
jgi:membrane protein